MLPPKNITDRLTFANWFLSNRFNHKKLIFSDESWFELGTLNHYVWRIEGEIYYTVEKHDNLHPRKVMIWGGTGYNFRTHLVIFTKSVNKIVYINEAIKGSNLKVEADSHFGTNNWVLQQDNARPHKAEYTMDTFRNMNINVLQN